MKVIQLATCFLVGSLLFNIGCKTDAKQQTALTGRWEMQYAEINGQPAPSLERIYFQFDKATVSTNFNEETSDQTVPFSFDGEKIVAKSATPIEFAVESLSDSTLEMTTAMRGYDFKLTLHRSSLPPQ
jgi:hypothetical protein